MTVIVQPTSALPAELPPWRADLAAGLTTALVLVPQAMGYALLAGLPPLTGLHAATLALLVYAVLGSSAALAIGPVAMDSLLTAVALSSLDLPDPAQRVAAAGLLAAMVGATLVVMGLLRLGYLTNFLSTPVVLGFSSAAAVLIVLTQAAALTGLPATRAADLVGLLGHIGRHVAQVRGTVLAVGATAVVALVLLQKHRPQWPRSPMVLIAATLATECLPWLHSLPRVGAVPRALPGPHLQDAALSWGQTLAPHALTLALVAFVEAYSVAKRYVERCGEPRPSREMVALGAANLASAASGGLPIAAGLSRSAVLMAAGGRSRWTGVITAVAVLTVTLALGPLLARIPTAALAAVVVVSVSSLIDIGALRRVRQVKPLDAALLAATSLVTLAAGFLWGIGLGVLLSIAAFLVESTRPHMAVLGRIPGSQAYRSIARYPHAEQIAGLLLVRVDGQLYFGNVAFLRDQMAALEAAAGAGLEAVILDASGINQLDSTAETELARLADGYAKRGIRFGLASVKGPVRDVMQRSGLWQRLGRDRLYFDIPYAVAALRPSQPIDPEDPDALTPAI